MQEALSWRLRAGGSEQEALILTLRHGIHAVLRLATHAALIDSIDAERERQKTAQQVHAQHKADVKFLISFRNILC